MHELSSVHVPGMALNACNSDPPRRICHKNALQQVAALPGYLDIGWELVFYPQDAL